MDIDLLERDIHPHETEEFSKREQNIRHIPQNFEVEERSSCRWKNFGSHDRKWYRQCAEHHECDNPGGPPKSDFRLKFVEDSWIDHTTWSD